MLGWKCPGLKLRSGKVLCYYLLDDYLLREDASADLFITVNMECLAVEKNYPMFSRPMDHDAFLAELSGKEAEETTGRGYSG